MISKTIDGIRLNIVDNKCSIYISNSMSGLKYSMWKKDNDTEIQNFKEANIENYDRPVPIHNDTQITKERW